MEAKYIDDDIEYVTIKDPYGFIYITTNLINGKRYLGQKRFINNWKNYIGSGTVLKNASKKYSRENFKKDIIDIAYSEEELNQKEYEYSVFFDVVNSDDWYNLVFGGGSTSGYKFSEEQRQKLSEAKKGIRVSEAAKKKMSESRMGHPVSEETKIKIGNVHRGRTLTAEHIEKVRQGNLGKHLTEEAKQKISKANRGRKHTKRTQTKPQGPAPTLIYCVELDMLFYGLLDANKKTGVDIAHINACCNNKQYRKSAGKHPITKEKMHWNYVYDHNKNDGTVVYGAITLGYLTQAEVDNYLNNSQNKGE